jgi:hypothetical protein
MNEILKVLIPVLSGFLVAFLAEPVKVFFQNRIRKQNLRVALYKEILSNYAFLSTYLETYRLSLDISKDSMSGYSEYVRKEFANFSGHLFRTECYKHALSQELPLFYQLTEAMMVNALYTSLNMILEPPTDPMTDKRQLDISFAEDYLDTLAIEIEAGTFDKNLLVKISDKKTVKEILERDRKRGSSQK